MKWTIILINLGLIAGGWTLWKTDGLTPDTMAILFILFLLVNIAGLFALRMQRPGADMLQD